jgi:hypothetical protein
VHDYKMGEALPTPGFLNARRTVLDVPLDDFFFTQDYANVVGASREGRGQVVNSTCGGPSPPSTCPACRTWARASHGCGRRPVVASTNLATPRSA